MPSSRRPVVVFTVASLFSFAAFVACVGDDPGASSSSSSGGSSGASSGGSSGGSSGASSGEPCTATSCGAHGTCENQACKCEAGYGGATCGTCAEGFQDKDSNGTCEAACGPSACGAHTTCDDATGKVACTCAAGYSGTPCVWGGGLLDPTFQNTPANAWTADRGASIEPISAGSQEPGWALFPQASSCTTKGRVFQTITMPAFTQAEPFALKMNGRATCLGVDCSSYVRGVAVLLNDSFARVGFGFNNSFGFQELCLGERAYGGQLRVAMQALSHGCGDNDYTVYVDRAEIIPQTSCPIPGQIRNANFEGTDGWTPEVSGASTAAIVDGAGVNGTRGGRITTAQECQRSALTNIVSVPAASVPNTALKINYKTSTSTVTSDVSLNGFFIGQLTGKTAFGTTTLCIPEWAKGGVHELRIGLQTEGHRSCASALPRQIDIDELSWATDASCAADAKAVDTGVERVDPATNWRFVEDGTPGGNVDRISDNTKAHTGSGSIKLLSFRACGAATAETSITIPPASGANGPAVKFYYTRTNNSAAQFSASTDNGSAILAPAAGYTQKVLCLDPKRVGQADHLRFFATAFGSCTTFVSPNEEAYFDDVEVGTDPSCPAQ